MEDGSIERDNTNFPIMNFLMVGKLFVVNPDLCSAGLRNVKTSTQVMPFNASTFKKTLFDCDKKYLTIHK